MRVMITGGRGQLGRELQFTAPNDVVYFVPGSHQLDISDAGATARFIEQNRPDVIVNAAAYTAVDRAEQEPTRARAINVDAVANLARVVAMSGLRLIHISTDYVFDGRQSTPYPPDAPLSPLGVYGQSKADGERAAREIAGNQVTVFRTAWLYAAGGENFVHTMLRLMGERDELRVVADQVGTPTWARGLAQAVWAAVRRSETAGRVFHWTDAGVASWYDFAVAIEEEGRALGLLDQATAIAPISTAEYPTPAARPAYSVLDKRETWAALDLVPVHWRCALRRMLAELKG